MHRSRSIPNVADERLCRLIVHDEMRERARKLGFFGWITLPFSFATDGATVGGDLRRERGSDRMHVYAVAVDDAAQTLSADERQHLRATAEVPDWFMDDVERRYREIRKQR